MGRLARFLAGALAALSLMANPAMAFPIWGGGGSGGGAGTGTVTSIIAGLGLGTTAGTCGSGTITTTGTLSACMAEATKTTDYNVLNGDASKLLVMNSSSAHAFNLPQATASGNFAAGWCTNFINIGTGIATITPATSTINALASIALNQNGFVSLCSDGTNYFGQVYGGATNQTARNITVAFDGGGSTPTVGKIVYLSNIPYSGTITGVTMLSDQSCSAVVDVWKVAYASAPPTVSNTIDASALPTLSSAQKYNDTTLTGWSKTITAGDTMAFKLNSVATCTFISLTLQVTAN